MNKKELRWLLLEKRKDIINKKELSTIIVDKILNLDIYKKAKVIALYKSMNDEVNTDLLIMESLKNKCVLLPKIVDDKIIFVRIDNNTIYEKSGFGVIEPIGKEYLGNIDLVIVPGVSFDKKMNRLGFGKGYYDKYLKDKNVFKVGICFDNQMMDLLPTNELDVKMDMIITESN